jgi:hypothetical protein
VNCIGNEQINMRPVFRNNGTALLLVVFVVALLAAVVMGMLQIITEDVQAMSNQVFAAEAQEIAEAGMHDMLYRVRKDWQWDGYIITENFGGGSYTVTATGTRPNLFLESMGTSAQGFVCKVRAGLVVDESTYPYPIRIENFRVN